MSEVTQILSAIDRGEPQAAAQLLPLVYDELRKLAAQKLAHERPGQTLDATGLVHDAYLRLVGDQRFENRRHFFAAAAEAMRRILIESARRKASQKRGGDRQQFPLAEVDLPLRRPYEEILAIHDALDQLALIDSHAADLVKLRYFAGFTLEQAAKVLEVSPRTADALWAYARAWLRDRLDAAT